MTAESSAAALCIYLEGRMVDDAGRQREVAGEKTLVTRQPAVKGGEERYWALVCKPCFLVSSQRSRRRELRRSTRDKGEKTRERNDVRGASDN